jgi:hypothetical protein
MSAPVTLEVLITQSHELLLGRSQNGEAALSPRELLVQRVPSWRDSRSAWLLVNRLVEFAERRLAQAAGNARDAARAEDAYVAALDLYDEIRVETLRLTSSRER